MAFMMGSLALLRRRRRAAWPAARGPSPVKSALGANDGDRTHDIQDHNLALYRLSYVRHKAAGRYPVQPAAVNPARVSFSMPPGRDTPKCRASRETASSSTASCLQNANRA